MSVELVAKNGKQGIREERVGIHNKNPKLVFFFYISNFYLKNLFTL